MLPAAVPNSRIMRYGYKSDWFGPAAIKQSARNVAARLLAALRRERKGCTDRPLIFIAHSFGGLVVLKAVCDTYHDRKEWPGVFDAVRGLVFFGTPFRGADGMSQSEMVQAAAREYTAEDIEQEPLHILDLGNELLQDLVDDFQKRVWVQMPHARIACFFELQASEIGSIVGKQRRKAFAVNERSGCLDLSDRVSKHPLARTHFNMNKFGRATEEDYLLVAEVLKEMARDARQPLPIAAPSVVSIPVETTYEQARRRRVKYFRGRQKQLERIQEYFTDDAADECRVLILQAMGGQGKSQIALEYCRRRRSTYAEIFWINASSETIATQSMERVAAEIGQPLAGIDDTRTKIRLVVQALARRSERWLMVLDNYDDPDHFTSIEQFIPSHSIGDILITSRSKGLEGLGRVVVVPPMNEHEGTELLLHEHPPSQVHTHKEKCREIVRRLGGLPLALDQAAAFIRYRQLAPNQIDEFLTLYDAQCAQILQHTPRFWKYRTTQVDGKEEENRAISAFTTWEMSFQQLEDNEARRRDVEHFLTVSAFVQPGQIGEPLFRYHWELSQPAPAWMKIFSLEESSRNKYDQSSSPNKASNSYSVDHSTVLSELGPDATHCESPVLSREAWNAKLFSDLISKAYDLSLLDSISSDSSGYCTHFSLHPVICDWLQLRVREESTHGFVYEAIKMVTDSIRQMDRSINHSLQARMVLFGHVDMCVKHDRRFSSDGRRLGQELNSCVAAEWFASFYQDQGQYRVAEGLYRQVSDTREKIVGREDPSTLRSMNNLASALSRQGKYAEAEEMHRGELELSKKVQGEEHPETLTSINNLAYLLALRSRFVQAAIFYERAIAGYRRVLGPDHPTTKACAEHYSSFRNSRGNKK
ncbi:hypothetical protein, variant [Cladophialophora immunda]|nr:hypothetical protein, variant [Cladophialophora immunda]KIW24807.1 hypothetical protein, variant [Cladophialophora immunda]